MAFPPTALTQMLGIQYPIIMAPMFLVSDANMTIAAMQTGIAACIPAHNYRSTRDLRNAIAQIRANTQSGALGINIVTNRSNLHAKEQIAACAELRVDFIITALGNPQEVIERCQPLGIKVFCDVIDAQYAEKVVKQGADALIAVNVLAGGHAGNLPPEALIPMLRQQFDVPIISAGGVGNAAQLQAMLDLGACGVSVGSPFIATTEAPVNQAYKEALVQYGAKDIVMTTKISGTPCAVINTPYLQKIGTKQNWIEAMLSRHKRLRKWVKMLTLYKGMKSLEQAAFGATYQTVWCAGKSIEYVTAVRPIAEVVKQLTGA